MSKLGMMLAGGVEAAAKSYSGLMADEIKMQNQEIIRNREYDYAVRMKALDEDTRERAAARERARLGEYSKGTVKEKLGATEVDDDGNSNTIRRKKTLEEIRQSMMEGGDIKAAESIARDIDQREDRASRERVAASNMAARERMNDADNETKLSAVKDADGNIIVKGQGSAQFTREAMRLSDRYKAADRDVKSLRVAIEKLELNGDLPRTEKARLIAKREADLAEAQARVAKALEDQDKFFDRLQKPAAATSPAPTTPPAGAVVPTPFPASSNKLPSPIEALNMFRARQRGTNG